MGALSNQLKTVALLAILTALMLWIGSLFGQSGLIIAIVIVAVMNIAGYFFSDKIALTMYRAKKADEKEYRQLHQMVAEIAVLANIPKPDVYIIPSPHMNAFASGRSPKKAVVAFTEGIIAALSKNELRGVAAHEIAHIKNRDILITTVVAMVAGVISYAASMAQWAAIFGGFGRSEEGGSGIIELLVMIILAPLLAMIIRFAISRQREYLADSTGAGFIKDPYSLASALEKLERGAQARPLQFGPEGGESLFIVNPFKGAHFLKLLSTHPPMDERVKRLRAMRL